jgi:hypothetical protein
MKHIVQSNNTYYIGDIASQIKVLKAQFLQLYPAAPHIYNDEGFQKAVKSLCSRVAKHFGEKFDKNAESLQDEINSLIKKIPNSADGGIPSANLFDGEENEQSGQETVEDEAVQPQSGSEA